MLIDFTKVDAEEKSFTLLEEGKHVLKVTNCEKSFTKNNNEVFKFTFEDKDGNKVWDDLIFTEKTLNRVKKYFSNLGLNVEGKFDYQPEDTIGCFMNAELTIESYVDRNGNSKKKNAINIWGSEKYSVTKKAPVKKVVEDTEEVPF
jgi:hypothetical protein